jgi:DNA-binding SARP family transcriptional activator
MSQKPSIEIWTLGKFEVHINGEPVPKERWGRPKTLQFFKMLLSDYGKLFTQDQLIDALFPDLPLDSATNNLQGRVSELRKALEPELKRGNQSKYIERSPQGYQLHLDDNVWLDIQEFDTLAESAQSAKRQEKWNQAIEHFEQALELYQGAFLPDDVYEDWRQTSEQLGKQKWLVALEGIVHCKAKLGQFDSAMMYLDQMIDDEPSGEKNYYLKMVFLYLLGKETEAIGVYAICEKVLAEAYDSAPSERTIDLKEGIQNGHVRLPPDVNYVPLSSTELLKQVPMFKGLNEEELREIVNISTERDFAADTMIFRHGDLGEHFYLVLSGAVDILLTNGVAIPRGRGQFFGEMALFDDAPRSADVQSRTDTRCLLIQQDALMTLLLDKPQITLTILKEVVRRLRISDGNIS